ncbi:hypothetical protein EAI_14650 [Harpegnathos saltator]|uniref:Uncharacterized protein n=1 Tax=Harpegnathos saltator TaxID=610380 RepID=E2C1U3_HARSA|nr:hypothetical protein EAI_14650 [Harpegnathos saltator]
MSKFEEASKVRSFEASNTKSSMKNYTSIRDSWIQCRGFNTWRRTESWGDPSKSARGTTTERYMM